jgi:hypothetical protein
MVEIQGYFNQKCAFLHAPGWGYGLSSLKFKMKPLSKIHFEYNLPGMKTALILFS